MSILGNSIIDNEYLRLFLSSIVMTLSVFLFYSVGLAICVPLLLLGYSYYYESSLLRRRVVTRANEQDIKYNQTYDYLIMGHFIFNVVIPGVFIQFVYFLFYSSPFDLSNWLYDLLAYLSMHINNNNSYFIEWSQSIPIFGYKTYFIFMSGEEKIVVHNYALFFLFYFVSIAMFIVGLVGAFFRIKDKNYNKIAKIIYSENPIENNLKNTKINPRALVQVIFYVFIIGILPVYLGWKFQQPIFDSSKIFLTILIIYGLSAMMPLFFYNLISRIREIDNDH